MNDHTDPGAIIADWWRGHLLDRQTGAARGLAARLRRAEGIEALLEPQVQSLAHSLRSQDSARLLRLVRVLAELRGDHGGTLARRLGGAEPVLSTARFQTLMRAADEDLATALVRAIRSLGPENRACNIAALGRDLWFWNDKTRARWTFDYFGAPLPAPLQETNA